MFHNISRCSCCRPRPACRPPCPPYPPFPPFPPQPPVTPDLGGFLAFSSDYPLFFNPQENAMFVQSLGFGDHNEVDLNNPSRYTAISFMTPRAITITGLSARIISVTNPDITPSVLSIAFTVYRYDIASKQFIPIGVQVTLPPVANALQEGQVFTNAVSGLKIAVPANEQLMLGVHTSAQSTPAVGFSGLAFAGLSYK